MDWRLGGSGLLAVLGLVQDVGDLDITVAASALDQVRGALEPWSPRIEVGDAPLPWCSDWIARTLVDGVEVDVIGGFCLVTPRGRVEVPQELGGYLDVDGVAIPLADPGAWWWVYRAYKPAKAALLEHVIPAERRAILLRELGPPTG